KNLFLLEYCFVFLDYYCLKDFPSFSSLYLYKNKYIAKTIFANFFTKIITRKKGAGLATFSC
ncbi:hypothetical protein ER70_09855, partial (plasmid) [Borreliella bissettiae]